jgi:hypothetical protein
VLSVCCSAYCAESWNSSNQQQKSDCFLFSFGSDIQPSLSKYIVRPESARQAMCCLSNCGPTFGGHCNIVGNHREVQVVHSKLMRALATHRMTAALLFACSFFFVHLFLSGYGAAAAFASAPVEGYHFMLAPGFQDGLPAGQMAGGTCSCCMT